MIEGEGSEQIYREVPMPPRHDTVTHDEYEAAIQQLREFTLADIRGVTDLDDTGELIDRFQVGLSLRAIAIQHGRPRQGAHVFFGPTPEEARAGVILPDYSLVRDVDKTELTLSYSSDPQGATSPFILNPGTQRDIEYCFFRSDDRSREGIFLEREGYFVNVPATASFIEIPERAYANIFAFERQIPTIPKEETINGIGVVNEFDYRPFEHPKVGEVQRGYLGYLQRAARDILSLHLPPPTPVPAAFSK